MALTVQTYPSFYAALQPSRQHGARQLWRRACSRFVDACAQRAIEARADTNRIWIIQEDQVAFQQAQRIWSDALVWAVREEK